MKKVNLTIMMLAMMVAALSFVACSSSGDDNSEYNGGKEENTYSKGKRIIKRSTEIIKRSSTMEGIAKKTTNYTYDSEGRVFKMVEDENGKKTTTTFTYGDHFITRINNHNEKTEYVIENGLIVRETYGNKKMVYYTFDNGYVSQSVSNAHYIKYKWDNGDLITIEQYDNQTDEMTSSTTYEYSNHIDIGASIWNADDEEPLWEYKGKAPRYLPSKVIEIDVKKGTITQITYDWTIEGNYPIKRIGIGTVNEFDLKIIETFEWE